MKKKMTDEGTFEGGEKDYKEMMHSLFAVITPCAMILAIVSSFFYCYVRFGWGGILANALIIMLISIIGEKATVKVDNVDPKG